MRIAFISYEYPVDTPFGGISTYTHQAAHLLARRGHEVEVFAGSQTRDALVADGNVTVHLGKECNRMDFPVLAGHRFATRHAERPFDVLEAPELYAEGRKAVELVPGIPFVVRMHTPNLKIWRLSLERRGFREIASDLWGQLYSLPWYLRRGHRIPDFRFTHPELGLAQHDDVRENQAAMRADAVVALFPGMRDFLKNVWQIPAEKILVIPNPFTPSPELLNIPAGTAPGTVSFIGRLEVRKGILELMAAIPLILKHHPKTTFRFVGKPGRLRSGENIEAHLRQTLAAHADRLEFTGKLRPEEMPEAYAGTGIVVAPSRWENYPYACLEAMAAGRAVVGSSAGGMAEMLAGDAGLLVPPQQPAALAKAVSRLLDNPALQRELGEKARLKVLADHQEDAIAKRMEACYVQAITHRNTHGTRHS
jgi:glycogen(starch) synthase